MKKSLQPISTCHMKSILFMNHQVLHKMSENRKKSWTNLRLPLSKKSIGSSFFGHHGVHTWLVFSVGSWRRYQPVQIWKDKSLKCRESVDMYLIAHAWKEVNILKMSMKKNMESCFSFQAVHLKHIHGNRCELLNHIAGYKKWRTMGIFSRVPLTT